MPGTTEESSSFQTVAGWRNGFRQLPPRSSAARLELWASEVRKTLASVSMSNAAASGLATTGVDRRVLAGPSGVSERWPGDWNRRGVGQLHPPPSAIREDASWLRAAVLALTRIVRRRRLCRPKTTQAARMPEFAVTHSRYIPKYPLMPGTLLSSRNPQLSRSWFADSACFQRRCGIYCRRSPGQDLRRSDAASEERVRS